MEVEVTWTQREIERGKKVSYNKSSKSAEGLEKLCVSSVKLMPPTCELGGVCPEYEPHPYINLEGPPCVILFL